MANKKVLLEKLEASLCNVRLDEDFKGALVELKESIEEENGFEPDEDFEPTVGWLLTCVNNYVSGVCYRRRKNMKDTNVIKALAKLPEETRKELLKKMGINE